MPDLKTILLVEDEALIALRERNILEGAGYRVAHAWNGRGAVEMACSADQPVDLVLMDLDLGDGIDGAEAARQVLGQRDLPIIFLSMHTEPEWVEKAGQVASYGYVVKDCAPAVLLASVKTAIRLHETRLQLQEGAARSAGPLERGQPAEDSAREQEYKTLVENSPDVIARFDRGYRCTYVNPVVEKEWGVAPPALLGKTRREAGLPADEASWFEGMIRRVFETGQEIHFELTHPSPEGSKVYLSRGVPELDPDGTVRSALFIFNNITGRKRMEDALRQSEARMQAMFQAIPDLIFRMDSDGVFLNYKADISELYAQNQPTLIGLRNRDISPPEFADLIDAKIRETLATGDLQTFEYDLPLAGRGVHHYEARMAVSGHAEVTAIVRDITDRKLAEESLIAERQRFLGLLEELPAFVYLQSSDYRIRFANRYFRETFGDPAGKRCYELMWGGDAPCENCMTFRVFHSRVPEHKQWSVLSNGRVYQIYIYPFTDTDGSPMVLEMGIDMTDYKQATDALRDSEDRFRSIFEGAPDAIFLADPEQGVVLDANEAACRLLGRPREEIIGMHQSSLHPPQAEDFARESFRQHIAESQAQRFSRPIANAVLRADGTEVPVEVMAQMIRQNDRQVLMGTFRDITERKQAEDQIKTLLREKELLLREVHHRIKNNMSTIISLLNVQIQLQQDASSRAVLQDASSRVQSMMVLYDKLYQSQDFRMVSLKDYIPALLHEIVVLFPHGGSVTIETGVDELVLPPQKLSPLGIILTELTTNAMKYAFNGRAEGKIRVAAQLEDGQVHITFEDNGVGLPETDTAVNTHHFGMYLVEMLVAQLEGTITIARGPGTRFAIAFPA